MLDSAGVDCRGCCGCCGCCCCCGSGGCVSCWRWSLVRGAAAETRWRGHRCDQCVGVHHPRCFDRDRPLLAGGWKHATEKFEISAACPPRGRWGVALSQNTWCEGVDVGVVERWWPRSGRVLGSHVMWERGGVYTTYDRCGNVVRGCWYRELRASGQYGAHTTCIGSVVRGSGIGRLGLWCAIGRNGAHRH